MRGLGGESGEVVSLFPSSLEVRGGAEVGGVRTQNGAVENIVVGGYSAAGSHGLKEAWIGAPCGMPVHIDTAALTERLRELWIKIGVDPNEMRMSTKAFEKGLGVGIGPIA